MALITRFVNTASTAGGDGTTNNTTGATRAYADLSEWEAAEQTNLVSAGDIAQVICSGSKDSTSTIISGWTTGASNYIQILTTDDRHDGVFDSAKYFKDTGTGTLTHIDIREDFVRVEGLQFRRDSSTPSSDVRRCIFVDFVGSGDIRVEKNIFKSIAPDVVGSMAAFAVNDSSPLHYLFRNNVIYDFDGSSDIGLGGNAGSPQIRDYCNTYINCTNASRGRATILSKDNVYQDCVTDQTGTPNASNDFNLTDQGSIIGSNSVTSSTLTFENKAADNFALASGDTDAIGAGVGPSTDSDVPTDDIIGTARSGTTTDIGAFMFISAGGVIIPIMQYYYSRLRNG